MGFKVLHGGLQSLIKDLGRMGFRGAGVPISGVLDPYRYFWVNGILGNSRYNPIVEMKMIGVEIEFDTDHLIALTGFSAETFLDDKKLHLFRPYKVKKGQVLKVGKINENGTIYLGIRGNWNLDKALGSVSSDLLTPFAGLLGRALKKGDKVSIENDTVPIDYSVSIPEEILVRRTGLKTIRILTGPESNLLKNGKKNHLSDNIITIDRTSNRMGLRLVSEIPVLRVNKNMLSSFVHPGTIQASSEKNLILLLNHSQTTGGYPRVAQVIRGDMYKLAYLGPGDQILFKWTTIEEAKYIERYQWGQFNLLWNLYFE
ncbi:biotin-dependent carboxyltransferase family protein [Membranihabitans maritimus]|uniref:5-oxoprolinase subunit C family protein n=1 Tax=Membranihabitans maritimus TaxID=2904244 RepID=UPI001F359A50|nr:biotin-dependent carboxyltransferase family protein [Membranihabitans maritimus]